LDGFLAAAGKAHWVAREANGLIRFDLRITSLGLLSGER